MPTTHNSLMPSLPQITQLTVIIMCLISQIGCSTPSRSITAPSIASNTTITSPSIQSVQQSTATPPLPTIVTVATSLLGVRYRYGGVSPEKGFDCSGFVYYSHQQLGIELPRAIEAQFALTRPVARQNLSPGDLVFFRTRRGRLQHVGIYLGQNRFIHAPSTGKVVSITTLDNAYWKPRFARGGRLVL